MATTQAQRGRRMNGDDFWRTEVSPRISELARAQEQTAVILERIQGQIAVQNNRITSLEGQPANSRASASSLWQAVGSVTSVVSLFVGGLGCLLTPLVATVLSVVASLIVWLITSR